MMKSFVLAALFLAASATAQEEAIDDQRRLDVYPDYGSARNRDESIFNSLNSGLRGKFPYLPSYTMFNEYQKYFQSNGLTQVAFDIPLYELDDNDLNIRFNKWGEVVDDVPRVLGKDDYPLSLENAEWIRKSDCWSVIAEDDCRECEIPFYYVLKFLGGCPPQPVGDPNHPFWDEMREVALVQYQRLRDEPVSNVANMRMPRTWSGYNLEDCARAVHGEYPGHNQQLIIIDLLGKKTPMDYDIIPSPSRTEFVRGAVLLAHINTWAVARVGAQNFGMKWTCGRARPEEVCFKIAQDEFTVDDGVPADIVDLCKGLNMTVATDFTAYPEGSPNHPSWPAMHSAGSASSAWLPVVLQMDDKDVCEVKKVDYAVSYARTIAGVHYMEDNIAGLNLGMMVVSHYLPYMLQRYYQSDPATVRAKIERYMFDWRDFLDSPCGQGFYD